MAGVGNGHELSDNIMFLCYGNTYDFSLCVVNHYVHYRLFSLLFKFTFYAYVSPINYLSIFVRRNLSLPIITLPIPVAARSKAWVCDRSLARIVGFESRRGHGYLSLASVVCYQVKVYASGWSLVQRSPTECGMSKCDREASIMRRPRPTRGCWP
jgi:hypothetical protein